MEKHAIISIKADDQITAILDAVEKSRADRIELSVPVGADLFHDILNLRILKHELEHHAKRLTIVTEDSEGATLAKRVGFSVASPAEGEARPTGRPAPLEARARAAAPTARRDLPLTGPASQDKAGGGESFLGSWKPRKRSEEGFVLTPSFSPSRHRPRVADIIVSAKKPAGMPSGATPLRQAEEYAVKIDKERLEKEQFPQPERLSEESREKRSRLFLVVIGVFTLAAIAALAALVKPSARLTIFPKRESAEFEMEIQGRIDAAQPDPAKALIPAERLRAEIRESREFPATGEKDLVTRAHGSLTIYNAFGSQPQGLVATTRFLSEGGKIFRTPKAVVVPGAKISEGQLVPGTITVEVVADKAGEDHNIPPGRFSIPGFSGTPKANAFYAIAESPMAGGFVGKARVVSREDIAQAENILAPIVKSRTEDDLRSKFPPNLLLIEGALNIRIAERAASPGENERADTFTYRLASFGEALLIRGEDVLTILEPQVQAHLALDRRIRQETRNITYTIREADAARGHLSFVAVFTVTTEAVIDQEGIVTSIAGMRLSNTKNFFLREPNIERVHVALRPFWARRMPKDPERITVEIGEERTKK